MLARRAQPLLGTLVEVQIAAMDDASRAGAAVEAAFTAIAHIDRVMSAHRADSDLARLACAGPGTVVEVDPHTSAVLRLAQHWRRCSRGAFDATAAGARLAARGMRPGIAAACAVPWQLMPDGRVRVSAPAAIDLGGIAKGYAVDRAIDVLLAHGVRCALVNAGGDLRAIGQRPWPVEVRHARVAQRRPRFTRLRSGALASSVAGTDNAEFVATRSRGRASWRRATVLARDCVTADALTKWALQDALPSLQLKSALRAVGARLWRD